MNTSLIVIDSSDDEDGDRISENWTSYVESYLRDNENDHDEAINARIRSKLRKKPRFLLRYVFQHAAPPQSSIRSRSFRNLPKVMDLNDRSSPEIRTTDNVYCHLDTKTLRRKPCHRPGFFFNKRGALRSTKQVRPSRISNVSLIDISFRSRTTSGLLSNNTRASTNSITTGRRNISPTMTLIRSIISGCTLIDQMITSNNQTSTCRRPFPPILHSHPIVIIDSTVSMTPKIHSLLSRTFGPCISCN